MNDMLGIVELTDPQQLMDLHLGALMLLWGTLRRVMPTLPLAAMALDLICSLEKP